MNYTDTQRLDFLLRFIRIDDVGGDFQVPGICINHEDLEDKLSELHGWDDDLRSVIDRAIEEHGGVGKRSRSLSEPAGNTYREKNGTIKAFQWDGDMNASNWPEWAKEIVDEGGIKFIGLHDSPNELHIYGGNNNGGNCKSMISGWWVTLDSKGKIDCCNPSKFKDTYEKCEE